MKRFLFGVRSVLIGDGTDTDEYREQSREKCFRERIVNTSVMLSLRGWWGGQMEKFSNRWVNMSGGLAGNWVEDRFRRCQCTQQWQEEP